MNFRLNADRVRTAARASAPTCRFRVRPFDIKTDDGRCTNEARRSTRTWSSSTSPRWKRPTVHEGDLLMARLRVQAFGISIDGYGAGPHQDVQNPLGVGGLALHEWVFGTRTFR